MVVSGTKTERGGNKLEFRYGGDWERDYKSLLKRLVPEANIKVTKLPDGVWPDKRWREVGAITEVSLS